MARDTSFPLDPLPALQSAVDTIAWPALPSRTACAVLGYLAQLERTQWWAPERLLERQLEQLGLLLSHCWRHLPYYRPSLEEAGFRPDHALTLEIWRRLPVLDRRQLQDDGAALLSPHIPKAHGKTSLRTSSGSSGRHISVTVTEIYGHVWNAITVRELLWYRRDPTKTLAAIRGRMKGATYPEGRKLPTWGPPINELFATGAAAALTSVTPIPQQVDWLRRWNPHYLVTMPQNLFALAEYCRQEGIALPNLCDISTYGGVVRPEDREVCHEAWGATVSDTYSAEETGYIALQCPEQMSYHVQSESAFVEILDAEGRLCGPGEIGRVVVTPLHNFATPLLRYDLGDFAEVAEPCPCGRGLPTLKRIIGRARDMLTLPGGEQVSPAFVGGLFKDFPVLQFQVAQVARDRLTARLVARESIDEATEARMRAAMLERLPAAYEIAFEYLDEIPRSPGGKFQDFTSEMNS